MTTLTLDAVKEWLERPSMHQGDIRMGNISIADILTEWLKQREALELVLTSDISPYLHRQITALLGEGE